MKNRNITLITLILSAFIACDIFAAEKEKSGTKGNDMSNMEMTPMADALKAKSGDEFEAAYLGMMVNHHQDGIKMARMALAKASSFDLKQMMQKAIKEQQDDIDKMETMLKKHNKSAKDFSAPPASRQMMSTATSELQGVSGSEFDTKFAQHMAHHHTDAIAMSKMAQSKAKSADVKQLASKTVSSQTEERQKLQKMAKI